MKLIAISYTVIAIAFASLAFGTTETTDSVAPMLSELKISLISEQGKVLKRSDVAPQATILVGIPAKVQIPSACTEFVGQENSLIKNKFIKVRALGARNPLHDACIEVMPAPVDTVLTIPITYQSNEVGVNRTVERVIQIGTKNFLLMVDLESEQVKVSPIFYDTLR